MLVMEFLEKQMAVPAHEQKSISESPSVPARWGFFKVLGVLVLAMLISALVAAWAIKAYIFPSEFSPVKLSSSEEQTLKDKIEKFTEFDSRKAAGIKGSRVDTEVLSTEKYTESDADRKISLSERELNFMISQNSDLADRVSIDLSDDLISAHILVPLDPDFPIMGGKTLRVKAGLNLSYRDKNPVVIVKGITLMGVPVPNAWLGGIKNVDLISEFGDVDGFWKSFSAGVKNIEVADGQLNVELRE
jgi:hypothetical protein